MESAHDAKDAIMAYREEVVKTIMAYRAEVEEVIQAIPLQILREIESVLPLPTEQKGLSRSSGTPRAGVGISGRMGTDAPVCAQKPEQLFEPSSQEARPTPGRASDGACDR